MTKRSNSSRLFDYLNLAFLILFSFVTLYPFWNVLTISLTPYEIAVHSPIVLFPTEISWEGYKYVFSSDSLLKGLIVSLGVTVGVTIYQFAITSIAAYALTKKDLPGRNAVLMFILFTMFFNGGLIPYYLLIKSLGLIDSWLVLILPAAINTFNLIVIKTYFQGLPAEIEESALMDGAGYFRIYLQIILPVSLPIVATICLFISVAAWNEWFNAMLFLNSREKWPLSLILRDIIVQSNTDIGNQASVHNKTALLSETIKMSVIMISILPIMLVYPFIQKYFVKGVMIGAVKS